MLVLVLCCLLLDRLPAAAGRSEPNMWTGESADREWAASEPEDDPDSTATLSFEISKVQLEEGGATVERCELLLRYFPSEGFANDEDENRWFGEKTLRLGSTHFTKLRLGNDYEYAVDDCRSLTGVTRNLRGAEVLEPEQQADNQYLIKYKSRVKFSGAALYFYIEEETYWPAGDQYDVRFGLTQFVRAQFDKQNVHVVRLQMQDSGSLRLQTFRPTPHFDNDELEISDCGGAESDCLKPVIPHYDSKNQR